LYDGGSPALISEQRAVITINVIRNLNAPVFANASYSRTIRKDVSFGSSVATITATDADGQVTLTASLTYS
jgi:hypothetical protein